jgi:hypothetical protein
MFEDELSIHKIHIGQSILYLHLSQDLMSFSSIHAGLSKLSLKEGGTVESLD